MVQLINRKNFLLTEIFFLWQIIVSFDRNLLLVTGHFVQWQEILSCDSIFRLWKEIFSYGLQFCLLRWKFFLWQEMSSCDRKFLPVKGNFPLTENVVHWMERSYFNRKFLPGTGNFFLWQEKSSCDREFLLVTGYFSLRQKISSCGTKLFAKYFFPGQDISGIFHPSNINSQQKCMIFVQNFAWGFKASSQDSLHPGR